MALKKPFIAEKFIAYSGDVVQTKLSLAVWLIDAFTRERPDGNIKVNLKEDKRLKSIHNPSDYYCFTDLKPGKYNVVVVSDWYTHEPTSVDVPVLDANEKDGISKNPVVEITLHPLPSYPFSSGATLIRGIVKSNTGPVVDAQVNGKYKSDDKEATNKTRTDHNGEFVLYLLKEIRLEEDGTTISAIGLTIVKDGNTKPVPVEPEKPFKEGTTASLKEIKFP